MRDQSLSFAPSETVTQSLSLSYTSSYALKPAVVRLEWPADGVIAGDVIREYDPSVRTVVLRVDYGALESAVAFPNPSKRCFRMFPEPLAIVDSFTYEVNRTESWMHVVLPYLPRYRNYDDIFFYLNFSKDCFAHHTQPLPLEGFWMRIVRCRMGTTLINKLTVGNGETLNTFRRIARRLLCCDANGWFA